MTDTTAPTGAEAGTPPRRKMALAVVQLDYQMTQDLVKMLTDIRFRLLAILPPIVAVSVTLVSKQTFGEVSPLAMSAIGLMGFFVTLGFVLYDQRNSELYNACVHRAKILEGVLGFVRRGDEVLKSGASSDTQAISSAIASIGRPDPPYPNGPRDPDEADVWVAGGPHTQRAPSFLKILGFRVSHGSALALVYGVLLGAWVFPIARGLLVLVGKILLIRDWMHSNAILDWMHSNNIGGVTSALAFAFAMAGAYAFKSSLNAADVPGAVHGLYSNEEPDEEPDADQKAKAALSVQEWSIEAQRRAAVDAWNDNAKKVAAELTLINAAKNSWFSTVMLSTDSPKEGVWERICQRCCRIRKARERKRRQEENRSAWNSFKTNERKKAKEESTRHGKD